MHAAGGCVIHGHDAIAHYLLCSGGELQLRSEFDNMTPLQAATRHRRSELVQWLKERGAREVRTPFWWRWLPI